VFEWYSRRRHRTSWLTRERERERLMFFVYVITMFSDYKIKSPGAMLFNASCNEQVFSPKP